jgi:hypothetical protein
LWDGTLKSAGILGVFSHFEPYFGGFEGQDPKFWSYLELLIDD